MSAQLRVVWEGTAPGLEQKRLSLLAFGPALNALLKAARNIAKRQVAAATGQEYDADGATRSNLVDLQISTYAGGSADTTFDVVPLPHPAGGMSLFDDFSAQIVRELLAGISDESQGKRRDRFVGEYLKALPQGTALQRYSVIINGQSETPLEIREMRLLELPEPPTAMVRVEGMVDGVSFGEKTEPSVRFAPWVGKLLTLSATKDQVEEAVRLRGEKVQILVLQVADRPRLLWIRHANEVMPRLSADDRKEHFLTRWDSVLQELAK